MTILFALGYVIMGAFVAIMGLCALAPTLIALAIRQMLHR